MKKIAIIGCGNLGSIIAKETKKQLSSYYEIVSLYDVYEPAAKALSEIVNAPAASSVDELLEKKPDYVIEATAPVVLKNLATKILKSGSDMIVLSVGAFADKEFTEQIEKSALDLGRKIYIASGAIGGFDIMQAAMAKGNVKASVFNIKNPKSLYGAPYLEGKTLSETESEVIFEGNAIDAIAAFPKNVNVAVAAALATNGPENTKVVVKSDPSKVRNTHRIELMGDFGEAHLEIASAPSKDNPRSSEIAAFSVVSKLKNLAAGIVFC